MSAIGNPSFNGPSRKRRGKYLVRTRSKKRQKTTSTKKQVQLTKSVARKVMLGLAETKYLHWVYKDQQPDEEINAEMVVGYSVTASGVVSPETHFPITNIYRGNTVSKRDGQDITLMSINMQAHIYGSGAAAFIGNYMPPMIRVLVVQWLSTTTGLHTEVNDAKSGPLSSKVSQALSPDWGMAMAPYNTAESPNCKVLYDYKFAAPIEYNQGDPGAIPPTQGYIQPWSKVLNINLKNFRKRVSFNSKATTPNTWSSDIVSGAIGIYLLMDDTYVAGPAQDVYMRVVGKTTFKDI